MDTTRVLKIILVTGLLLVTTAADFTYRTGGEPLAGETEALEAQAPDAWPTIALEQLNIGTLASPVYLTHAGDGSGRLFIVERAGRIRLLKNGNLQTTPFLDISGHVRSTGGEEGLLSVAFPPDYTRRKQFYVYYTQSDGDNVVARFHTSANPDQADALSEEQILELPHPNQTNHNGGQLEFGPDGYLYIGPGDGGGGGDPYENGQNHATLLGKILRINVEGQFPSTINQPYKVYLPLIGSETGLPYAIPSDNPFLNQPGYRAEIWALGLRNPWRFTFDRTTGDLYIGDVGQNSREEVDFQPASSSGGANYGWNNLEGTTCYDPPSGCTTPPNYSAPVTEYLHGPNNSNGCSITGGYVYRGSAYPDMQGVYFFADYCQGKIWGLKFESAAWQSQLLLDTNHSPSSFGEDQNGEVYLVSLSGQIYHLVSTSP